MKALAQNFALGLEVRWSRCLGFNERLPPMQLVYISSQTARGGAEAWDFGLTSWTVRLGIHGLLRRIVCTQHAGGMVCLIVN